MIQCSFTVNGPGLNVNSHRHILNIRRGNTLAIILPKKYESSRATIEPIIIGKSRNQKNWLTNEKRQLNRRLRSHERNVKHGIVGSSLFDTLAATSSYGDWSLVVVLNGLLGATELFRLVMPTVELPLWKETCSSSTTGVMGGILWDLFEIHRILLIFDGNGGRRKSRIVIAKLDSSTCWTFHNCINYMSSKFKRRMRIFHSCTQLCLLTIKQHIIFFWACIIKAYSEKLSW
jgi:hypothetical protein